MSLNHSRRKNLRIAVICSSNQNRSMEAHSILSKQGFNVKSYGTGTHVKLPGVSIDKPNIYSFNTTYDSMYKDLYKKDPDFYKQNGVLHMLNRNRRIKSSPQRFQDDHDSQFDIVLTAEERVFDQVVEELNRREASSFQQVHIVNLDIKDNHEDATLGAFLMCELCEKAELLEDFDDDISDLLEQFEKKARRSILHTVAFY